jgi:dTDP-4-amino-4,6-dideoxygalactose transaminase
MKEVYSSDKLILGKAVSDFEKSYAKFSGVPYCVGTGNGLDALYLSLKALGIGRGDEVIVPANTCIPTWMAVSNTGANVVPVEPDILSYNIDPSRITASITSATKAIIPVHLYGQACAMTSIMSIAKKHGLYVVEDNAQGHGAMHKGKMTGSFGDVNATSFYPTKNLGAIGDAGAVTTKSKKYYNQVGALRNYGSIVKNRYDVVGINSRLDELQAAVLSVKLNELTKWNEQRKALAALYVNGLKGCGDIVLPVTAKDCTHVYHLFVIRTKRRDQLRAWLAKQGIQSMIHYPVPPHLQPAYAMDFGKGSFPITEEISDTALSLPLWPGMSRVDVGAVILAIRSFF